MNFVNLLLLGFVLGLIIKVFKRSLRFIFSIVVVFVLIAYLMQLFHFL